VKVIIKPNCIKTHGSPEKAFDEAVKQLKERFLIWTDMPLYNGVNWELTLKKEEPYFSEDTNMIRCGQCGTHHMRGTMCHKCF